MNDMCICSVTPFVGARLGVVIVGRDGKDLDRELILEPERCPECGKLSITPRQTARAARQAQRDEMYAAMKEAASTARRRAVEPIFDAAVAQLRGRGMVRIATLVVAAAVMVLVGWPSPIWWRNTVMPGLLILYELSVILFPGITLKGTGVWLEAMVEERRRSATGGN